MDLWILSLCLSVIYTMVHVGNGEGNRVQTESMIAVTVGVKNTPVVSSHETTLATCEAHGPPPGAELLWNKDSLGTDINSKVVTNSSKNQDGTIVVTMHLMSVPSREMNQKEVLCLARHPTLSQDKAIRYTINVHYPPQSVKISAIGQGLGGPKGFECSADANPQPTYAWIREDPSLLSPGLRTEGNELEFSPEMYGLYTCEVVNPYGIAKHHITMYTDIAESETPLSVMSWIVIIVITVAVFVIILLFQCKGKKIPELFKDLVTKLQSSSPI